MNTQLSNGKLYLKVIGPEKAHFEGEVKAVSSINQAGPFDILFEHENFISIVKDQFIIHTSNSKQKINIDRGILKVEANKIQLFIGIEIFEADEEGS